MVYTFQVIVNYIIDNQMINKMLGLHRRVHFSLKN